MACRISTSRNTCQTQGDQSGLKLSRSLFGKTVPSTCFNGISSGFQAVGLSKLLRGGSVTPSLLSLKQTSSRRLITESQLALGLGSGSSRNPLISLKQAASATSTVALGFSGLANQYSEDQQWAFQMALLLSIAMAAIISNLAGTASASLKVTFKNGVSLSHVNCAFHASRVQ